MQGPARERCKKNTNHGKILLKRRVVERVAQWQLQLQPKGEGEDAGIENETGPETEPCLFLELVATLETRAFIYGEYLIFEFRISCCLPLPPSHSLPSSVRNLRRVALTF